MKKFKKSNLMKTTTISILLMLFVVSASATVWRVNKNPNMTVDCDHCFNDLDPVGCHFT